MFKFAKARAKDLRNAIIVFTAEGVDNVPDALFLLEQLQDEARKARNK